MGGSAFSTCRVCIFRILPHAHYTAMTRRECVGEATSSLKIASDLALGRRGRSLRSAFKSHFRFVGAAHHNRSARQRLYVQAQKRRRGGQVARGRPPFRAATRRAAFEEPQASSLTSTNSKGGCLAHFRSRCVHGRRRSGVLRLRVEVGAGAQRPQPARPGTIQAANFLHH